MSSHIRDSLSLAKKATYEIVAQEAPKSWEGLIIPSSWDPTNGTVWVMIGNTMAADNPMKLGPIPLLSPGVGIQVAPLGLERAVVIHTEGGYAAMVIHGTDDTPQAPGGEVWLQLNQLVNSGVAPSAQKTYIRLQSDNAIRIGGQNKVSSIAPIIEMGTAEGAAQNPNNGIARLSDLQDLEQKMRRAMQDALNTMALEVQPGSGVASPNIAQSTPVASKVSFSG